MEFQWDVHNETKVLAHGIETVEAEEALLDPHRIHAPAYRVPGERRWAELAASENGRILFVVFTRRGRLIRVVTARDATTGEKRRYRWRRG